MKYGKIALLMSAALMISSVPTYAKTLEFKIGSPDMYISDGAVSKSVLDCKPYTSNDRTLVPVRVISENFGAEVSWDDATQRVDIVSGETKISLNIGSNIAVVNGEKVMLDVSPELTDSRTMVPLRFISEALGKRVEYIEASEQVVISDDGYAITVGESGISIDDIKAFSIAMGINNNDLLVEEFDTVKAAVVEVTAISDKAAIEGMTSSSEDIQLMKDEILDSAEFVYGLGSLTAPYVKMMIRDSDTYKYISSVDFSTDMEEAEKIYNDEFICIKHLHLKTYDTSPEFEFDDSKKSEVKKKAEEFLKEIKNKGNFEELHEKHNEDYEAFFYPNGMLVREGDIIKSIGDAAFALDVNEVSDVVQSQFGYHIIKRLPLPEFSEDVYNEISATLNLENEREFKTAILNESNVVCHMTDEEIIAKILKQ